MGNLPFEKQKFRLVGKPTDKKKRRSHFYDHSHHRSHGGHCYRSPGMMPAHSFTLKPAVFVQIDPNRALLVLLPLNLSQTTTLTGR